MTEKSSHVNKSFSSHLGDHQDGEERGKGGHHAAALGAGAAAAEEPDDEHDDPEDDEDDRDVEVVVAEEVQVVLHLGLHEGAGADEDGADHEDEEVEDEEEVLHQAVAAVVHLGGLRSVWSGRLICKEVIVLYIQRQRESLQ